MALLTITSKCPWCLVPREEHRKIKKSSRKVQGVPKAPAKDLHLVSNPHEEARMHRCTKHPQEDSLYQGRPNVAGLLKTKAAPIILRRRRRSGGLRQALHLMSNPCEVLTVSGLS
jgi:hypothetical protein